MNMAVKKVSGPKAIQKELEALKALMRWILAVSITANGSMREHEINAASEPESGIEM